MCQFKSAICLKDRVFVPDYDSHSDMLEELGIEDDFVHASKVFVRVELSPTDGGISSDVYGWKLKVDQDIQPDWWDEAVDAPRIKDAIKEWCDKHILREGVHEVKEGVWYACNSSTVKAYGSSTVTACNSSTVKAYDSSTVTACNSSTVTAYDSSTVTACNSSTVKACNSSTVTAYDSSTVTAYDSSTVKAYDSSTVTACNSSTVKAYGSSTVILPRFWQTCKIVNLNDEAVCVNHKTHSVSSCIRWEVKE